VLSLLDLPLSERFDGRPIPLRGGTADP